MVRLTRTSPQATSSCGAPQVDRDEWMFAPNTLEYQLFLTPEQVESESITSNSVTRKVKTPFEAY
jgi:hypothetical protein